MDFNNINNINGEIRYNPERKPENKPAAKKEQTNERTPEKKSPADPKYWQNIAFGGLKRTEVKTPEQLAQEGREYYNEALEAMRRINWRGTDDDIKTAKDKLEELIPQGREIMECYFEFFEQAFNEYGSQRDNFLELTNVLFDSDVGLTPSDAKTMLPIVRGISGYFKYSLDEKKEFLGFLLNNTELSAKEKKDWFVYSEVHNLMDKPSEEVTCNLSSFKKYINAANNDEEKKFLMSAKFDPPMLKKCGELLEEGTFTPVDLLNCSKCSSLFGFTSDENLQSLITFMHERAILENDNSCVLFAKLLARPELARRGLELKNIEEAIRKNDPFEKKVTEWFVNSAAKKGKYFFENGKEFFSILSMLAPENFEDFKECYSKREKNGDTSMYMFESFVNPKTKLFDKRIFNLGEEYEEKTKKYLSEIYAQYDTQAYNIAAACVDAQTGEISQEAVDFTNKYYFGIEDDSTLGKLKSAVKSLKRRNKFTQPIYKSGEQQPVFSEILGMIKDKNGAVNSTNIRYMSKILEMPSRAYGTDFSFFKYLKDENGVVDRQKFKFAYNIIEKTSNMHKASEVLEVFLKMGFNKANKAYQEAVKLFGSDSNAMFSFALYAEHCVGEGEDKKSNLDFVQKLVNATKRNVTLSEKLILAAQDEDNRNLILDIAKKSNLNSTDLDSLAEIILNATKDGKKLDKFTVDNLYKYVSLHAPLFHFDSILNACITDKDNPENNFKKDDFYKLSALYGYNSYLCSEIDTQSMIDILNGRNNFSNLKFKDRVTLLNALMDIKEKIVGKEKSLEGIFDIDTLDTTITILDKSLKDESVYLPIDEKYQKDFIDSVLGSSDVDENGRNHFDNVLVKSIPVLESMPNGIDLSYSREQFLEDLTSLCDSEEKIKILKEKTGILPVLSKNGDETEIKGYNGIILLDKLDKNDEFENKLYNLMHKFVYENEAQTYDSELNTELNRILKACPEFINTIGKPQHGTHNYSLDVHSLLVLARSLENPSYSDLNSTDKTMLKTACIFHDIAKQEAEHDPGHQEPSSIYSRSIVKKFFNNEDTRDRVYELIKNHHWLEQYVNAQDKEKAAKETAYKFRRPNDYEIAKIMAKSDLMSVSESFYEGRKDALKEENLAPIEKWLEKFYSTGCAVFLDYPIEEKSSQIPVETKNGKQYQVINFHNIAENEDLGKYGFESGKTKNDVNFLVHMVDQQKMKNGLNTVEMLTSSVNGGVLSESIISPKYNRTYGLRKYGVILSQINSNVVNMSSSNQGSGFQKDFSNIMELVFGGWTSSSRGNFRNGILEQLGIDPSGVTDKEFAEFYKKNIISKTRYSQFVESREYNLGGKTFTGKDLVSAIKNYQNSLIDKKEENHNEIVGYIPKIKAVVAKEKSLNDVPDELLNFAEENKLPVILI